MLRTVENAHASCITACAFSADLDLVATGDDAGSVQVYDFQKLYLLFRCNDSHSHEIRALHFHVQAPLLLSGDAAGVVFVWQTIGVGYTAAPLMRLALQGPAATTGPTASPTTPHSSRHQQQQASQGLSITAICSTPESADSEKPLVLAACEDGAVYAWDFRVLASTAARRQRANGVHFAYATSLPSVDAPLGAVVTSPQRNSEGYNPLLRVAHKQSVLKLRPEDRNGGGSRSGLSGRHQQQQAVLAESGVQTCVASLSWAAHDDAVLVLQRVPDPGMVFTASQDGTIRVWDASCECMGEISTLASGASDRMTSRQSKPPPAAQPSTDAWKFTRHVSSDASQQHAEIAAEVLRKHARAKKRAQKLSTTAVDLKRDSDATVGASSDTEDALAAPPHATTSKTTLTTHGGVAAVLATQLPFSGTHSAHSCGGYQRRHC